MVFFFAFFFAWVLSLGILESARSAGTQAKLLAAFWIALAAVLGLFRWTNVVQLIKKSLLFSMCYRPISLIKGERQTILHAIGIAVIGILIALGLAMQLKGGRKNLKRDPTRYLHYPSVERANWIDAHTARTAVLMARQESIVHRISGLRSFLFWSVAIRTSSWRSCGNIK